MHEQVERAKADYRSRCEARFDALADWGKLELDQPDVEPQEFSEPMPERPPVKRFFGEVYVRLAGGPIDHNDRNWLKKSSKHR